MEVQGNPTSVSARAAAPGKLVTATLVATLALWVLTLSGCGQKGPLTLTPKAPAATGASKAAPAPAESASRPAGPARTPAP